MIDLAGYELYTTGESVWRCVAWIGLCWLMFITPMVAVGLADWRMRRK